MYHEEVLFLMAKYWKPLKSPSMGKWMNKFWYIHPIEIYLSIKRNELLIYATPWINLKSILTSKKKFSFNLKTLHTICSY